MKLLLVTCTCLVASVLAAPAEKTKRDILFGDPRYDAKLHKHHEEHGPQKNEVEISEALGGFTGTFLVPDVNFDFSEFEFGSSLGNKNSVNVGFDAIKEADGSEAVKIGGSKALEQFKSGTEDSSDTTLSKVDSAPEVKPSSITESNVTSSTDFDVLTRSQIIDDAEKESPKNASETQAETKSADATKTTIKSGTTDTNSPAKAFSSDLDLATDSLASTFFDSSFDSDFTSIGQSDYSPSFRSDNEYTPGFDGFNTNFEFYNNHAGYPLGFDTYSRFNQELKGQTIDSNIPADFSELNPVGFTKSESYLAPSSFSSLASVSETAPSQLKFSPDQSYLSLILEQPKTQFIDTVVSRGQPQLFKNYSPLSLAQPTSTSFHAPIQPEVKITDGSYSGASQLTDANGGYIY